MHDVNIYSRTEMIFLGAKLLLLLFPVNALLEAMVKFNATFCTTLQDNDYGRRERLKNVTFSPKKELFSLRLYSEKGRRTVSCTNKHSIKKSYLLCILSEENVTTSGLNTLSQAILVFVTVR